MNALHERLLGAFEIHDVDGIRAILDAGFDAASSIDGRPAVTHLLELGNVPNRYLAQ